MSSPYRKPCLPVDRSPTEPKSRTGLTIRIPSLMEQMQSRLDSERALHEWHHKEALPFGTHSECPKCGGSFSTKLCRMDGTEHLERECNCGFKWFELCKDEQKRGLSSDGEPL